MKRNDFGLGRAGNTAGNPRERIGRRHGEMRVKIGMVSMIGSGVDRTHAVAVGFRRGIIDL